MKRFFYLSLLSLICAVPPLRAQDAAAVASRQEADENYKILRAKVEDLSESRTALLKRIQVLEKELSDLRSQMAKPPANFASPEDLKRLADTVREMDKKREDDKKLVLKEIADLGKAVSRPVSHPPRDIPPPHAEEATPPPASNQPTFTYTIKSGDTYSTIAQAYREQGIKVTSDMIQKANPNVKPTQLYVGKKIQIPDTRNSAPDSK